MKNQRGTIVSYVIGGTGGGHVTAFIIDEAIPNIETIIDLCIEHCRADVYILWGSGSAPVPNLDQVVLTARYKTIHRVEFTVQTPTQLRRPYVRDYLIESVPVVPMKLLTEPAQIEILDTPENVMTSLKYVADNIGCWAHEVPQKHRDYLLGEKMIEYSFNQSCLRLTPRGRKFLIDNS